MFITLPNVLITHNAIRNSFSLTSSYSGTIYDVFRAYSRPIVPLFANVHLALSLGLTESLLFVCTIVPLMPRDDSDEASN